MKKILLQKKSSVEIYGGIFFCYHKENFLKGSERRDLRSGDVAPIS